MGGQYSGNKLGVSAGDGPLSLPSDGGRFKSDDANGTWNSLADQHTESTDTL